MSNMDVVNEYHNGFEYCIECGQKTLNINTTGMQNGKHFKIKFGKWCKKCRIIFVDKSIKVKDVRYERITLTFGWGYTKSRSKKIHYFTHKDLSTSICGKEKMFNDMIVKFLPEQSLFKNQKCEICVKLLETKNEKMVTVISD